MKRSSSAGPVCVRATNHEVGGSCRLIYASDTRSCAERKRRAVNPRPLACHASARIAASRQFPTNPSSCPIRYYPGLVTFYRVGDRFGDKSVTGLELWESCQIGNGLKLVRPCDSGYSGSPLGSGARTSQVKAVAAGRATAESPCGGCGAGRDRTTRKCCHARPVNSYEQTCRVDGWHSEFTGEIGSRSVRSPGCPVNP
jgi:hypothetical protein